MAVDQYTCMVIHCIGLIVSQVVMLLLLAFGTLGTDKVNHTEHALRFTLLGNALIGFGTASFMIVLCFQIRWKIRSGRVAASKGMVCMMMGWLVAAGCRAAIYLVVACLILVYALKVSAYRIAIIVSVFIATCQIIFAMHHCYGLYKQMRDEVRTQRPMRWSRGRSGKEADRIMKWALRIRTEHREAKLREEKREESKAHKREGARSTKGKDKGKSGALFQKGKGGPVVTAYEDDEDDDEYQAAVGPRSSADDRASARQDSLTSTRSYGKDSAPSKFEGRVGFAEDDRDEDRRPQVSGKKKKKGVSLLKARRKGASTRSAQDDEGGDDYDIPE